MTLSEYIKTFPRLQRMALRQWIASQLGVSEVYVRSMCNSNKPVLAKYAFRIEKLTNGAVPKQVIAPEFYLLENMKEQKQ